MKGVIPLLAAAILARVPSALPSRSTGETMRLDIRRAVLEHLVKTKCQHRTCIAAVRGKSADAALIGVLAKLGRVERLQAGDLTVRNGATGAFRRASATVLDVQSERLGDSGTARVVVSELSTLIGRRNCLYLVRKARGEWSVDDAETTCSS